ncbi:MAG: ATP-binding protein [Candidatus Eremiobacteraeota bacterium]|nr:ATP-binding protein [Candidatus Eremiobacteraeota bacterium]
MRRIHSFYLFDEEINGGKMIFLSGPRQVGKTTFVKGRLKEVGCEDLYFNWDDPYVRREYARNPHFLKAYLAKPRKEKPLVAFEEIHKHRAWKNVLKGLYDLHSAEAQFIITGSARLDFFRQSGDSLVGRYFPYRMLPAGLAEVADDFHFVQKDAKFLSAPGPGGYLPLLQRVPEKPFKETFERLMRFSGFPEPYLKAREEFSRKWRKIYQSLLIGEDLRELSRIGDIKGIEQLLLLLPERVGSPLSVNSLREDLQVAHKTVVNWLEALKKIYLVFSISPWEGTLSRAIRKESKYYFFDWTMVKGEGPQFENALALGLLRFLCRLNEQGAGDFDLHYVRTREGHEVDFLITYDRKPLVLIEAKARERSLTRSVSYFSRLLSVPCFQVVWKLDDAEEHPGERFVVPAWRFFALLG